MREQNLRLRVRERNRWELVGRARCPHRAVHLERSRGLRTDRPTNFIPKPHVLLQFCARPDLFHLAAFLHRTIPGELSLRLRPRLSGECQPAADCGLHVARDLRRTHTPIPPRRISGKQTVPRPRSVVGHALLALANFRNGPREIAVHSSAFIERSKCASKMSMRGVSRRTRRLRSVFLRALRVLRETSKSSELS